jgi:cyclohexanone monooxygenase
VRDVEYDVVIIGAGFNGLYQLHRLREEGFQVVLLEAGSRLGGIWHWNCYPGARVDSHVPNYEFSMEAVWREWSWSERFPGHAELRAYFEHLDRTLNLTPDIRFNTRVTDAVFDPTNNTWQIRTDTQQQIKARFVVPCLGFASKPWIPEIPGLASFAGACHHTGLWPETGIDLTGKRVGVIGTGASGVQVIQEAAAVAADLTVFQRTPNLALPMRQQRYDAQSIAALKADYPRMLARRAISATTYHDIQALPRSALDVTPSERTERFEWAWQQGGFHFWAGTFNDVLSNRDANALAYAFWRNRTRERIHDPELARKLAPDTAPHPFGSKRPSLEQNYYEVFNQPNVTLVDLHEEPIERVTPEGVATRSREVPLDILVLATGFDASTGGITAIRWRGVDGVALEDVWRRGVVTHLGMAVPGFPNVLMLYGPQSPTAFCNGPTCAELQGEWVIDCLRYVRDSGHSRIEATAEAARVWGEHMREEFSDSLLHEADSWYVGANVPGKKRELLYYANTQKYLKLCHDVASAGYRGFQVSA